jgi:hypothetical protein
MKAMRCAGSRPLQANSPRTEDRPALIGFHCDRRKELLNISARHNFIRDESGVFHIKNCLFAAGEIEGVPYLALRSLSLNEMYWHQPLHHTASHENKFSSSNRQTIPCKKRFLILIARTLKDPSQKEIPNFKDLYKFTDKELN